MTEIRTMTAAELHLILDWAAEEGWNPGLEDAPAFHAADPVGFFVAVADDAPVGAISVVNHSPDLAFLGLYLCHPHWRGRGIGLRLWRHGMAHAGDRTVGLDGVAAQQANYARSGFALTGETRRYEGLVAGQPDAAIRPARPEDIPALVALEAAAFGYAKAAFLESWLRRTDTRQTHVLDSDGRLLGFATQRVCRTGRKIGPLVATDMQAAERLLLAAAAAGTGPVIIDVPDSQSQLVALCERLGMACSFATARMYKGPAPGATETLVASVATLELG
jgi:predicted N-acetyltransferase YhbS